MTQRTFNQNPPDTVDELLEKRQSTLHEKLLEIRKSCDFIQKQKQGNEGMRFAYVASSQTLKALRKKMDELGVLLIPNIVGHTVTEHPTRQGGKSFMTSVDFTFTWLNVENPHETLECKWYGQGVDSGEKGVGKAATYAEKYFLLKFFNIATDSDDPDVLQENANLAKNPAAAPARRPQNGRQDYPPRQQSNGHDRPPQRQTRQQSGSRRHTGRLPSNPKHMYAKQNGSCMLSGIQFRAGERIVFSSKTGLIALEDEYMSRLDAERSGEQLDNHQQAYRQDVEYNGDEYIQ